MTRPIGYYVHHQGAGHLHRARLIAGALRRPCVLIGTFADSEDDRGVSLPDDRVGAGFDGADGMSSRPKALHYAPLNHAGVRARMAAIAAWVALNDPALLIVDVSVEVALFVRLLSVPVILVRLAGRRDDPPHLEAFRAATALLAPFPAVFESPTTAAWVRAKTLYAGFLAPKVVAAQARPVAGEIAVVFGRGGASMTVRHLAEAASATPDWTWRVYGNPMLEDDCSPTNLHIHGWVDKIGVALDRAEIVIGGAGDGLLSAVVALGKRFVCVPEPRAFDEQVQKAGVLAERDLAIVLPNWPKAFEWREILLRALALDPAPLHAFNDRDSVEKIGTAIEDICLNIRRRDLLGPQPT